MNETEVPNAIINDDRLSAGCLGMIAWMMASPMKREWQNGDIEARFRCGTWRRRGLTMEAEMLGYLEYVNVRGTDGRFSPHWVLHTAPLSHDQRTRSWYDDRAPIGRCVYCGNPATTRDHVFPASRGGPDDDDNIVPACRRCNSRKGNRTPQEAGMEIRNVIQTT